MKNSVVRETKEGGRLCEGSPVLDQIAAEAALEIETNWKTATLSSTKAIIKSAIEKADIEGYWRGRGDAERFRAEPPATASKDFSRCVKHNTYPADNEPCWQCIVENIPAATPSSCGKKWTVEPCVGSLSGQKWLGLSYVRCGNHSIGSMNTEVAKQIVDAHNATLQPQGAVGLEQFDLLRIELSKARDDTKRLDWLDNWLEKVKWDDYASVREAIDAAMRKEAK